MPSSRAPAPIASSPDGVARVSMRTAGVAHFVDAASGAPLESQRGSVVVSCEGHSFGAAQAVLSG
jgi:hypothetical protein